MELLFENCMNEIPIAAARERHRYREKVSIYWLIYNNLSNSSEGEPWHGAMAKVVVI